MVEHCRVEEERFNAVWDRGGLGAVIPADIPRWVNSLWDRDGLGAVIPADIPRWVNSLWDRGSLGAVIPDFCWYSPVS